MDEEEEEEEEDAFHPETYENTSLVIVYIQTLLYCIRPASDIYARANISCIT
jgi:hypothetical protein